MPDLAALLKKAASDGKLLESSRKNIQSLLDGSDDPLYGQSIRELADAGQWDELNNRFFRTLAFGTGGLRGKTIGDIVTKAEQGKPQPLDRPEFPCVGTNAMNYYSISRATQGLAAYLKAWFRKENLPGNPKVCISYDTRHFSREFADRAATVLTENGCDALLFEAPRSTPELSFAVRMYGGSAGINITASHNPAQYNGYKVYFADGAQVVEPHASGIIKKVNAVECESYKPLNTADQGKRTMLGAETDSAYMERLATLTLDPELVRRENRLKIVYTPLHGTGAVIVKPMLQRLGFQCITVAEQEVPDGRFPTVKAPNPEYAAALSMGIALADKENADLVIATDPDDDRMGIAARNAAGKLELLTGNQIGSLMAWYRTQRYFELGVLTEKNRSRGVIIKTFVTTDLQKAIAAKFGLRCVETLTGFKYIGEKLGKYERAIPENLRKNYTQLSEAETRQLRLEHSSFYVFGGEESYGYSGSDFVRDKDGNSAVVMFAEVAAYAKSIDKTLPELLDDIYREYGFYLERGESLTYDGAEGAAKIKKLVDSYASEPPKTIDGKSVTSMQNFATEEIHDVEGDLIPHEAMLMMHVEGGLKVAVRPSGTEPKIKYYLFASATPKKGEDLTAVKAQVKKRLESLWTWLQADVERRLSH